MATLSDDERTTIFGLQRENLRRAAAMFAALTPEEWGTPSLCAGWTVREVAAHLVPPAGGHRRLALVAEVVRFRGDLHRMVDVRTRELALRPPEELVALATERAGVQLDAPGIGPLGPLVDTAIHLRDAARPLGSAAMPDPASWPWVLDFLSSRLATRGFVSRGRLDGLRLVATDLGWEHGRGASLEGPAEALALAVSGRDVALDDLAGPGVEQLRSRP